MHIGQGYMCFSCSLQGRKFKRALQISLSSPNRDFTEHF